MQRKEYWRLKDGKGNPPGLLGWWPSRSVTFLENHDTVSLLPLNLCHAARLAVVPATKFMIFSCH